MRRAVGAVMLVVGTLGFLWALAATVGWGPVVIIALLVVGTVLILS